MKDLLFCAVLGIFCLYLFREIILKGHHLIGVDFVQFYLPMKKFFFEEIYSHHSIPFWNPYIFGGMPFWAHFESTIFYPLGFLFWIISPLRAYDITMFAHFVLAGIFMYGLARSFGMRREGSFVAGAIFTCNGFVMAILYLGHMSPVQSYIWLPAVIGFLYRALTSGTPYTHAVLAGSSWGAQILAGAPQDAFYTFMASSLFLAFHVGGGGKTGRKLPEIILIAVLFFITGAALAAVQIIPAFELIGQSVRASLNTYEMVTKASYPPEGLITSILPRFFGDYVKDNFWVSNVPWSIPHQNLYVGILPLMLLPFISLHRGENMKILAFAGSLAVFSLVLALGRHTPLYQWVYLIPGFDKFRAPSKVLVLWGFSMGLLAGRGMDDLLDARKGPFSKRCLILILSVMGFLILDVVFFLDRSSLLKFFSPFILPDAIPSKISMASDLIRSEFHRLTLFSLSALLLILLTVRGLWNRYVGAVFLSGFLLFDLGYVNGGAVRHDDRIYARMDQIKYNLDEAIGKDDAMFRVGSHHFTLGPNFEMYLGYQSVSGFTALFPSRTYEYLNEYADCKLPQGWASFYYGNTDNGLFMDLLNVKYEISHERKNIVRRETCLPRVFLVPNSTVMTEEEVLATLKKSEFDPTTTLLLEKEDRHPPFVSQTPSGLTHSGEARIISYRPDEIVVETSSQAEQYLFLSEVFYPGWKAFVDDAEQKIWRANYLFRAVELSKGDHKVRFIFDPLSIKVGAAFSLLALMALGGFFTLSFVQRHRRQRSHGSSSLSTHP